MSPKLQRAPNLTGTFLVPHVAEVTLATCDKEGSGIKKGCMVPRLTTFLNHVTSAQVTLSTVEMWYAKPSQGAILKKYYYLNLLTTPPSFLWVGAVSAQGNHGSGKWEEMNLDYVYSQGKEERRQAEQSSTRNIASVFKLKIIPPLKIFFSLLFCPAYYKTASRTEIADCLKSKWQYLYQKCWQPAAQMGFCTAIFKPGLQK